MRADLDKGFALTMRGEMRLHLAIYLEAARLSLATCDRATAKGLEAGQSGD
ncbi:MAG: hypothetical protein ACREX9_20170 [Gammaproteobacteria bacterium]